MPFLQPSLHRALLLASLALLGACASSPDDENKATAVQRYQPPAPERVVQADGCIYDGTLTQAGEPGQGRYEGQGALRCPDGSLYTGDFHQGQRHGVGVQRDAAGDQYFGSFSNGLRDGAGLLRTAADGRAARVLVVRDTVLLRIPADVQELPCTGVPAGWLLVEGRCPGGRLEGDVLLVSASGKSRFQAPYRDGQPAGPAQQDWLREPASLSLRGNARGPGDFTSGVLLETEAPGVWTAFFRGSFAGLQPLAGSCLGRSGWEDCRYDNGQRVAQRSAGGS